MANWSAEQIKQWRLGTLKYCQAMLPDFPTGDGDEIEDARADLDVLFRSAVGLDDKEITVENALRDFQKWLVDNYVRPGMHKTEYLQVSVTRTIGREQVTFTLGSHMDIASNGGRSVGYDRLLDAVSTEFLRYQRDRATAAPAKATPESSETLGAGIVKVPATRLNVTVKNGKRIFDVMCGGWQKHGVPFYDEAIKAGGVKPNEIPLAGWDLSNYDAIVQCVGDKPKRVLRLEKRNA